MWNVKQTTNKWFPNVNFCFLKQWKWSGLKCYLKFRKFLCWIKVNDENYKHKVKILIKMFLIAICLLNCLFPCCNMLAQPKGFTDDPYVNDEKFIEKGMNLFVQNVGSFSLNVLSVVKHEVVGVIGEGVAIPCNCTPSYAHTGDKPALILWYKDKAKLPIYRWILLQGT